MFEQQIHDRVRARVVRHVQTEVLEVFVFTHESRRRVRQQRNELLQRFSRQGLFQVFDDIELDVSLAQDLQRAA